VGLGRFLRNGLFVADKRPPFAGTVQGNYGCVSIMITRMMSWLNLYEFNKVRVVSF
jgi:hypothetical protein